MFLWYHWIGNLYGFCFKNHPISNSRISNSYTPYLHLTDVQHVVFQIAAVFTCGIRFVLINVHLFPLDTTREHDNILDTGMLFILFVVHGSQGGQTFNVNIFFVDKDVVTVMADICEKNLCKQKQTKTYYIHVLYP